MKQKFLSLSLVFCFVLVLAACGGGNNSGKNMNAKEIYLQNCASCHGQNLEGGRGPSLENIGSKLTKKEILTQIEEGGGGMKPDIIEGKSAQKVAAWLSNKK